MKKSAILYVFMTSLIIFLLLDLASSSTSKKNRTIIIPISAHNDLAAGLYTIPLSFGTPPQNLELLLSTATSFVWSPCGYNYSCSNCFSFNIDPARIQKFYINTSSTWKPLRCNDPECWWVEAKRSQPHHHCLNCNPHRSLSCMKGCPLYEFQQGGWSTKGGLVADTLNLHNHSVDNFVFGCSKFSKGLPLGVAGLGRGLDSLPSQIGAKKFSYCLSSGVSDLKLQRKNTTNVGLSYTKFHHPTSSLQPSFKSYYYVILEEIIVGNVVIRIPKKLQVPEPNGHGGTIVDLATPFTVLESQIRRVVASEFIKQMGKDIYIGNRNGLGPCFKVSYNNLRTFPKLIFRFRGGANLELSYWNFFDFASYEGNVNCLAILEYVDDPSSRRPAIVFGAFQQRDVYFEYDFENKRFGFQNKDCVDKSEMVLKISK